jgi:Fic family protein
MEPMMPEYHCELADKAVDLIAKSSSLCGMLNADLKLAATDLARSLDCYYSNVIDGIDTQAVEIERALHEDFDDSEEKPDIQKKIIACIEVRGLIDNGKVPHSAFSKAFALWAHKAIYERLPESMLWTDKPNVIVPGGFRQTSFQPGIHETPEHGEIDTLLTHFEQAYDPVLHSRVRQVIAIAAAHHRFIWIQPFSNGNGLLTRLISHACLKQLGIDSSLWSLSSGLEKRSADYKRLLQAADKPHYNALNGCYNLSQRSLGRFCEFFLDVCIDQVNIIHNSMQPRDLQLRIGRYCAFETDAKRLLPGSWKLLREALLSGEFNRGKAAELTGKGSVQARKVLARLIEKGLLVSDTPKGAVRLGFPLHVLDQWMPGLYQ